MPKKERTQHIIEQQKAYRLKNKEAIKANEKKYRKNNKELLNKRMREWYKKNKKKRKLWVMAYTENNKEKVKQWKKTWYDKKGKEYARNYTRERNKQDCTFRLKNRIRTRIWDVLSGRIKKFSTRVLLDVPNLEFLWQHLETQFQPGMTRENYGLWHVDHIIPCVSFDLTDPEEQAKCFHYTNLQPLWAFDNISKGAKIL
jgi:hypothetical protein